jgi:capsular polysaccharide biosynthesis protein
MTLPVSLKGPAKRLLWPVARRWVVSPRAQAPARMLGGTRVTVSRGEGVGQDTPGVEVVERVGWEPTASALYLDDGRRVDAAARPFGPEGAVAYPDSPDHVRIDVRAQRVDGAFLWGGTLMTHFGHFLLEGIARLWAAERFPDLPILVNPEDPLAVPSFRTSFLRAAGIDSGRLVAATEPCIFEQVIVPLPSLVHDGGGHAVHRELTLRVAEALVPPGSATSERPVYLTRSRLERARRRAAAETELERALRRDGFLIVAPERLSLRHQIRLWRRHTTFVGQIGSAFHAALLAPAGRRTVVLAHEDGVPAHYGTIDALCATDATYVPCLRTDPESSKQRTHRDVMLDVDAALQSLRAAGLR